MTEKPTTLSPAVLDWMDALTEALRANQLEAALQALYRAAVGEDPARSAAWLREWLRERQAQSRPGPMAATHTGICSVCGQRTKLHPLNGTVQLHGHRRPRPGWTTEGCPGQRRSPVAGTVQQREGSP